MTKQASIRPEYWIFDHLYPMRKNWGKTRWHRYFADVHAAHVPLQTISGWLRYKRRRKEDGPAERQEVIRDNKQRGVDLIKQHWARQSHWHQTEWCRWLAARDVRISPSGISRWLNEMADRGAIDRQRRTSPRYQPRHISTEYVHTCSVHVDGIILHVPPAELLQQLKSTWRKLQDWLGAAWGGNWEASHWAPPDDRAVARLKMLPTVDSYFEPVATLRKWDCCWEYYAFGTDDYDTHGTTHRPSAPIPLPDVPPSTEGLTQREHKQLCIDLISQNWRDGLTQQQWAEWFRSMDITISIPTISRVLKTLREQGNITHYDARWEGRQTSNLINQS